MPPVLAAMSTLPVSFNFDVPIHPLSLHDALSDTKDLIAHHAAAIDQLDQIENTLKPFRNVLRMRREAYARQKEELARRNSKCFADTLPNDVLIQVFRFATLALFQDGQRRAPPVRRSVLADVCQQWKIVVESFVCIVYPIAIQLDLYKFSPRRLSFMLGREARFSGPLLVEVTYRLPYTKTPTEKIRDLDHLSRTLAKPHRAMLSLSFTKSPAALIQRLMIDAGCPTFPRIARITVDFLYSEEEERLSPPFQAEHPCTSSIPPTFPLLRSISIGNNWNAVGGIVGVSSLETACNSREWGWLFTPTTMQQLRSYASSKMTYKDFSWLLSHAPELRELSLSCDEGSDDQAATPNSTFVTSHPKLRRLSISSLTRKFVFECPSLNLLSYRCYNGSPRLIMSSQTAVNLTALSIHFAEVNPSTMLGAFRSLQSLTHLTINNEALSSFANAFQDPSICPLLRSLVVRFSRPTAAHTTHPGYTRAFGDTPTIARLLHQLVAPRLNGMPGIQTLDLRFDRPISEYHNRDIREDFVKMYRLLHPIDNEDDSHIPEIPLDVGIKSIRKLLDAGRKTSLEDLSAMWTTFVMVNQRIEQSTIQSEWWTDLDILWRTVERLKAVFAGTPYPLHLDILEKWQVFFSEKTKGWMISVNGGHSRGYERYMGLFYGPRTGSHLYDFRRQGSLLLTNGELKFLYSVVSSELGDRTEALACLGVGMD